LRGRRPLARAGGFEYGQEDQMKIIFAPKSIVEWVWDHLQPQQRFFGEIGSRSVKLSWEDTVLVPIESQIEFGKFETLTPEVTIKQFRESIDKGEYQKLALKPQE
jgi:hypothetical protein